MSSIEHHLTELYVFIDDFLTAHPALAQWRQSPHDQPAFADAEVLTIALPKDASGWPASSRPIDWWRTTAARLFRASVLTSNGWRVCRHSRFPFVPCYQPPCRFQLVAPPST